MVPAPAATSSSSPSPSCRSRSPQAPASPRNSPRPPRRPLRAPSFARVVGAGPAKSVPLKCLSKIKWTKIIRISDSDESSLLSLTKVFEDCNYRVVTCNHCDECLAKVGRKRETFVFAIIDVSIPTIGGYQLCERIRLVTDIPVFLISSTYINVETVEKVLEHGAVGFLLKPITAEDVGKINLDAVRRLSKSRGKCICGEKEQANLTISMEKQKVESVPDIQPAGRRKPRFIWTTELHKQFVEAVNELGINKAIPKKIMEKMKNPELSRETVSSHLQKYRLNCKKQQGKSRQQQESYHEQEQQHEYKSNEAASCSNHVVPFVPCDEPHLQVVEPAGLTPEPDFQASFLCHPYAGKTAAPKQDFDAPFLCHPLNPPMQMQMVHDPSQHLQDGPLNPPMQMQMVHDPCQRLQDGSLNPPIDMPQYEATFSGGQLCSRLNLSTQLDREYNMYSNNMMQQSHDCIPSLVNPTRIQNCECIPSLVNPTSIYAPGLCQFENTSFDATVSPIDPNVQPMFSSGYYEVAHCQSMVNPVYVEGEPSQPMVNLGDNTQGELPTFQTNQPHVGNAVEEEDESFEELKAIFLSIFPYS